jgi:hypothetical protein
MVPVMMAFDREVLGNIPGFMLSFAAIGSSGSDNRNIELCWLD